MIWSSFLITFFRLSPIPFEALAKCHSIDSVAYFNNEFTLDGNSTEGMDHRILGDSSLEKKKENQWQKMVESFYKQTLLTKLENTRISNHTKIECIEENPFSSREYEMHLLRHLDW
jgi:hypothetical protein